MCPKTCLGKSHVNASNLPLYRLDPICPVWVYSVTLSVNPFVLMDYPIHLETISIELSMLYTDVKKKTPHLKINVNISKTD